MLTLSATQINNSGTLSGAKELVASADTLTTTEKSVTNSDGNLMLNSASSTLAGETSAGGTVSVKGNSLEDHDHCADAGQQCQRGCAERTA